MDVMDAARVEILRDLLSSTGWVERTRRFARVLRRSSRYEGGLLLVGTPDDEPWHLAAHLAEESRLAGVPEIAPTLVRWRVPVDAPPHLSVTLQRLERAARGDAVFVVAPGVAPPPLLERVSGARRTGATVLVLDSGDVELEELAHEALSVPSTGIVLPGAVDLSAAPLSLDVVQHLVSAAAGEPVDGRRTGLRERLARLIDVVSGPAPHR
jgi:hypothetical protein